jgi:hypothetical protein
MCFVLWQHKVYKLFEIFQNCNLCYVTLQSKLEAAIHPLQKHST